MAVVIIKDNLTKEDVLKAREEYLTYIKITIDVRQKLVAIGGEYHIDAEEILIRDFNCKRSDIWGGGYKIETGEIIISAMSNIKPNQENNSMEILDPLIRERFLQIAKLKLANIKSFL